jgi:CRISPR-associated protein Cas1
MYIYLTEPGTVLYRDGGVIAAKKEDSEILRIPSAQVEGITLASGCHFTTETAEMFLLSEIPVVYTGTAGKFLGMLTGHTNIERQALQFERYNEPDFSLAMARHTIFGKWHNSRTVLRRYNRTVKSAVCDRIINAYTAYEHKIKTAESIEELSGFEGAFSKFYFEAIAELLTSEFKFRGRSKQPPRDPFNSLISFGYTMLYNEFVNALNLRGLSPYVGCMHKLKNGHAALASDLMEEWRSVIVDSLALKLLNAGSFKIEDFAFSVHNDGVYLCRDQHKRFIAEFETRMLTENRYIAEEKTSKTFREVLQYQITAFVRALETGNPDEYKPILIR